MRSIFTMMNDEQELEVFVYVNGVTGHSVTYDDANGGYFTSVDSYGYFHVDTIIEAKRLVYDYVVSQIPEDEYDLCIDNDTYTVALMTDYGYDTACRPLAIGVDHATARSIKRHYDKTCHWSDYTQTGDYVTIVSRKWCTNHEDFEHEYSPMYE